MHTKYASVSLWRFSINILTTKMNYQIKLIPILISIVIITFISCNNNNPENEKSTVEVSKTEKSVSPLQTEKLNRYDEADTAKISQWLRNSILKEDLDFLKPDHRKYSLDAYDLNNDGKPEYFIGFSNDYFCGSGGCTYYILSNEGKIISLFTVSNAPFLVLPSKNKGWNDLVINSTNGRRKLVFDGKSYPRNPSVLPLYEDSLINENAILVLEHPKSYSF